MQNKLPDCITMEILTVEQRSNENLSCFVCVCVCFASIGVFKLLFFLEFVAHISAFLFYLSNIFQILIIHFPLPPLLRSNFLSNSSPLTLPSFPFRKGQVSHGPQIEAEPRSSPCIKGGRRNPARGTGPIGESFFIQLSVVITWITSGLDGGMCALPFQHWPLTIVFSLNIRKGGATMRTCEGRKILSPFLSHSFKIQHCLLNIRLYEI